MQAAQFRTDPLLARRIPSAPPSFAARTANTGGRKHPGNGTATRHTRPPTAGRRIVVQTVAQIYLFIFQNKNREPGKFRTGKERETKKTAGRNGNGPRRTDRQNGSFTDSPDKERRRICLRPRGFFDRHDLSTLFTGKVAAPVVRSGHRDKD